MAYDRDDDIFRTSTDVFGGFESDFGGFDAEYETDYVSDQVPVDEKEPKESSAKKVDKRSRKKKKKKRKKKNYLLRFIVVVGVIVLMYFFLSSSIFNIEDIRVENNALLSDQEIIETSGIKAGDNIFAAGGVGVKRALKKNPYVEDVGIRRALPDRITISVTEVEPVIAVQHKGKYILLNENGDYIDYNDSSMYATIVTGVKVSKFSKGKTPEFEDPVLFEEALKLVNGINNAGMYLKQAEISSSMNIKGYVSDTLICSGTSKALLSNIDNVKYILYDLDQKGIKRGVVRIGEDGYSSFSPVTE